MTVSKNLLSASASGGANLYVESVFSTYLYTGNGSTQTITNGIDWATEGGLVWIKRRSSADYHVLFDSERTINKALYTNTTLAETTETNSITSRNVDGFTIGSGAAVNSNGNTFASWTFRKAPKFFDVVTYTGNNVAGREIAHNLGCEVGFIVIKRLDSTGNWCALHKDATLVQLNTTAAEYGSAVTAAYFGNDSTMIRPTSSVFTVGSTTQVNGSGGSYVAYLFAHDAGGFGDDGEQNVISCGSFTGQATVDLGWEPQLILYKVTNVAGDWKMVDNMRGLVVDNGSGAGDKVLKPNLSNAEAGDYVIDPTSTGFKGYESVGNTYIYIAIRRGPMKTPESGTEVFSPVFPTSTTTPSFSTGWPVDLAMHKLRGSSSFGTNATTRLQGTFELFTSDSTAETTDTSNVWSSNSGYGNGFTVNTTNIGWMFRRAPGFMDVVCYTGTGSSHTETHNLGVAPELMIVKSRSGVGKDWTIYHTDFGATKYINFDSSIFSTATDRWNNTAPSASAFTVGYSTHTNNSSEKYIAYLFATLSGISKVGSYTGNGSSQTINCGFSAGARFVLIKRTNSSGDWYVWDTARGIVSANDPHLSLNTTAAEVTTDDSVDPDATGFIVNQVAATNVNVSSASYIYLAIA